MCPCVQAACPCIRRHSTAPVHTKGSRCKRNPWEKRRCSCIRGWGQCIARLHTGSKASTARHRGWSWIRQCQARCSRCDRSQGGITCTECTPCKRECRTCPCRCRRSCEACRTLHAVYTKHDGISSQNWRETALLAGEQYVAAMHIHPSKLEKRAATLMKNEPGKHLSHGAQVLVSCRPHPVQTLVLYSLTRQLEQSRQVRSSAEVAVPSTQGPELTESCTRPHCRACKACSRCSCRVRSWRRCSERACTAPAGKWRCMGHTASCQRWKCQCDGGDALSHVVVVVGGYSDEEAAAVQGQLMYSPSAHGGQSMQIGLSYQVAPVQDSLRACSQLPPRSCTNHSLICTFFGTHLLHKKQANKLHAAVLKTHRSKCISPHETVWQVYLISRVASCTAEAVSGEIEGGAVARTKGQAIASFYGGLDVGTGWARAGAPLAALLRAYLQTHALLQNLRL